MTLTQLLTLLFCCSTSQHPHLTEVRVHEHLNNLTEEFTDITEESDAQDISSPILEDFPGTTETQTDSNKLKFTKHKQTSSPSLTLNLSAAITKIT